MERPGCSLFLVTKTNTHKHTHTHRHTYLPPLSPPTPLRAIAVGVCLHPGPQPSPISRRRRSGSEPRKAPVNMPRAPDTCRAPRSKSFFFGSSDTAKAATPSPPRPPAPLSDNGLLEEDEEEDNAGAGGLRISCDGGDSDIGGRGNGPAGSGNPLGGLEMTMDLWRQEKREGRPQSQAFEGRQSLESLRASVSSRLSSCPVSPIRRCVERSVFGRARPFARKIFF